MSAMTRLPCLLLMLLLLMGSVRPSPAARPNLLAHGGWTLSAPRPSDAALTTQSAMGAPGDGSVLRVTVAAPTDPLWLIQIARGIPAALPNGHRVRLHFWARSATRSPLRVTVEQNAAPYDSVCQDKVMLASAWREYTVQGVSSGWGPNTLSAHFQCGQQAGVIDIAGAAVTDLGPDPAIAAAQAALAPSRVQARIERYRKGTLTIRVVDARGRPVPRARVQVVQTRHAFLFGCNFFALSPDDPSPAQRAYQAQFTALFNYATLPFYWGAFEPQPGRADYAHLQAMAAWCVAHQITPKGHPLVWHQVWPAWAPTSPDKAIPLLHARVLDLVLRYKETIHYWDVVNEASGAANVRPANGETAWVGRDGPASVVETALGWARTASKGTAETFLYNDYETGPPNLALLAKLKADGKLPDAIGIQSHMHTGEWPLNKVWQVCETFSKFGRPIHFTETTVLSGPNRTPDYNGPAAADWPTTAAGEAEQARYVAQFYTLLFSHPSVRAITWWDFSDRGAWLGAPAGLLRADMSPKPVYTRLLALIRKQWWTRAAGTTNHAGAYAHCVFYGDYQIMVRDSQGHTKTQAVSFPEAAPPLAVTVRLP